MLLIPRLPILVGWGFPSGWERDLLTVVPKERLGSQSLLIKKYARLTILYYKILYSIRISPLSILVKHKNLILLNFINNPYCL